MKSAYCESFTVGPPQPDMIGLPGMSGLCILGSRYSVGVLVVFSGDKNLFVVSSMSWSSCIFLTSVLICCCICGVGSSLILW